jgi:hypothetical protein
MQQISKSCQREWYRSKSRERICRDYWQHSLSNYFTSQSSTAMWKSHVLVLNCSRSRDVNLGKSLGWTRKKFHWAKMWNEKVSARACSQGSMLVTRTRDITCKTSCFHDIISTNDPFLEFSRLNFYNSWLGKSKSSFPRFANTNINYLSRTERILWKKFKYSLNDNEPVGLANSSWLLTQKCENESNWQRLNHKLEHNISLNINIDVI